MFKGKTALVTRFVERARSPTQKLERLHAFWDRVEQGTPDGMARCWPGTGNPFTHWLTVTSDIPSFFKLNAQAWPGVQANVGLEQASYHDTRRCARRWSRGSTSSGWAAAPRA